MTKNRQQITNKQEKYIPQGPNDLFHNQMTKVAMDALSQEDKEKYRIIGEKLYGNINFENSEILDNKEPPIEEAVAYLESQLNSGLHPSNMEDNEKQILFNFYGDKWYEKWGYIKEDLNEITTC